MREEIAKVVQSGIGLKSPITNYESSFVEDLGADSLDMICLALALEEELGIDIDEDTIESLDTINAVYDYVNKNK